MAEPYLRIAVVHEDGTSAIYHVTEVRFDSAFQVNGEGYFVTVKPVTPTVVPESRRA